MLSVWPQTIYTWKGTTLKITGILADGSKLNGIQDSKGDVGDTLIYNNVYTCIYNVRLSTTIV